MMGKNKQEYYVIRDILDINNPNSYWEPFLDSEGEVFGSFSGPEDMIRIADESQDNDDVQGTLCVIKVTDEIIYAASRTECRRCGSPLKDGRCTDETCPFSDCDQNDSKGWAGHPEMDKSWK